MYVIASRLHPVPAATDGAADGAGAAAPSDWTNALVLDVQNTVSDDRSGAVLTVRSWWEATGPSGASEQGRRAAAPGPRPATEPAAPAVVGTAPNARPVPQGCFQLNTTARLPRGRTILIGGLTLDPTAGPAPAAGEAGAGANPAGDEPPQLYLFVEVTAD